jgi:hypothetical protein
VADSNDKHGHGAVVYSINDPVIANAGSPQALDSGKWLCAMWPRRLSERVDQITNSPPNVLRQPVEIAKGRGGDADDVSHGLQLEFLARHFPRDRLLLIRFDSRQDAPRGLGVVSIFDLFERAQILDRYKRRDLLPVPLKDDPFLPIRYAV